MLRALHSDRASRWCFIEVVLLRSVIRPLRDEETTVCRALLSREALLPTLVWPRQLPIEGAPAEMVDIVEQYGAWLAENRISKLFINADPGAIIAGRATDFCRTFANRREVPEVISSRKTRPRKSQRR